MLYVRQELFLNGDASQVPKSESNIIPASGCSCAASGVHGPAFTYPLFSRANTNPPSPITGPSANRSKIPF